MEEHKMTDQDAELLFGTLRNMADVYWMGQAASTITDPRVERSWGGGACPEQHWGYLTDGRCFYLRLRHSHASLQLGPKGLDPNEDLPLINPEWSNEEFDAALAAGEVYSKSFWMQPRPEINVYPEDDWFGNFRTEEDLQGTFTMLLDQILEAPTGAGWCAPSP